MGMAYNPKTRADDFHVQYLVKTTGDRFFIPYNDNASMADQLARCKSMTGVTRSGHAVNDIVGVYISSLLFSQSLAYGLPLWESPLWLLILTGLTLTNQSSTVGDVLSQPGLTS